MSGAREFRDALNRQTDQRHPLRAVHEAIDITGTVDTKAGTPLRYLGTIVGSDAQVEINARDRALSRGSRILARRAGDDLVSPEYEFVQILASPNPAEGYLLIDANIPYPDFAALPFETFITTAPGSITATGIVRLMQVAESYRPTGYKVSWRPTGTTAWQDQHILHRAGGDPVQVCQISNALVPGSQVDVKLATEVNWAQKASPDGPVQTFDVAEDTTSPGSVTGIAVDNSAPYVLRVRLTATVDPDLLLGYVYLFAHDSSGPAVVTSAVLPAEHPFVLPAGTYYVAAHPVSKAGVAGGRFPVSSFQGPYDIYAPAGLDTTAPPKPPPPLCVGEIWIGPDYIPRFNLRVTPDPSYAKPVDFSHYEGVAINLTDGIILPFEIHGA